MIKGIVSALVLLGVGMIAVDSIIAPMEYEQTIESIVPLVE